MLRTWKPSRIQGRELLAREKRCHWESNFSRKGRLSFQISSPSQRKHHYCEQYISYEQDVSNLHCHTFNQDSQTECRRYFVSFRTAYIAKSMSTSPCLQHANSQLHLIIIIIKHEAQIAQIKSIFRTRAASTYPAHHFKSHL